MAYLFNPARAQSETPASESDRYVSGFGFMIASDGLSAIGPPWSSLTVYDLNQGTIKWKLPLGEVPALAAKGIKDTGSHYPKVRPVVTAVMPSFVGPRRNKHQGRVLREATHVVVADL